MKLSSIILLYITTFATAEQHPQVPLSNEPTSREPHRIAIIGGGAAGSSAAYHLNKSANESQLAVPLRISLFEKEARIGGRTTTVNALNDTRFPTELGGSIFVRVNHILYSLAEEFGLEFKGKVLESQDRSDYDFGIWDGQRFVYKQSSGDGRWQGYWDIAKLLWKYGLAPLRTRNLAQMVVKKFLQFYERPLFFPFASLQGVIEETGLLDYTSISGQRLLEANNAGGAFGNDIVQASTRVNYAQNLDAIHGVEAMVCMSTEGAVAIQNGNWQIFDQAVKTSGAEAIMDTTISQVSKLKSHGASGYVLRTTDGTTYGPFDAVVLAAPYQFANIAFDPPLQHVPKAIDYVSLHVTLFTSPHLLSPAFFNLAADSQSAVPSTILTTLPSDSVPAADPHSFFSISHQRTIHPSASSIALNANLTTPQNLYKIFSPAPLTGTFLSQLFSFEHDAPSDASKDPISNLPSWHISWQLEKVWNSYPYEIPRKDFERIRLAGEDDAKGSGVWYTSGIESFISTMETSALMGSNVAALIVQELEGKT